MESTFASLATVAGRQFPMYPSRWLIRHPFNTIASAPQVTVPVLVVHSSNDEIIHVDNGQRLAAAFPNSTYVQISGRGHNDGVFHDDNPAARTLDSFLEEVAPSP